MGSARHTSSGDPCQLGLGFLLHGYGIERAYIIGTSISKAQGLSTIQCSPHIQQDYRQLLDKMVRFYTMMAARILE